MRNRSSNPVLTTMIANVIQSTMAARPSCHATTAIKAKDPTTTPSNIAAANGERRIFGSIRPLNATNINPGTNTPTVATTAPGIPATR